MSTKNWFERLFTVSKHTDPALANVEQPVLNSLGSAAGGILASATPAISPIVNEAVEKADALIDAALAKMGVTGTVLTPAAHTGVSILGAALQAQLTARISEFEVSQP